MALDNYKIYKDDIRISSLKKYIKISILSCLLCCFFYLVFPNAKTLAAMYVLPKIANNQDIQHVVNDNLKSLRLLSEKWLMELMQGNDKKEEK